MKCLCNSAVTREVFSVRKNKFEIHRPSGDGEGGRVSILLALPPDASIASVVGKTHICVGYTPPASVSAKTRTSDTMRTRAADFADRLLPGFGKRFATALELPSRMRA